VRLVGFLKRNLRLILLGCPSVDVTLGVQGEGK